MANETLGDALLRMPLLPIQSALNGALAADPVTLERLQRLAGREVLVHGPLALVIGFSVHGFELRPLSTASAAGTEAFDAEVIGTTVAFVETLRHRRPHPDLRLEGDPELLAELAGILAEMEPDPMALLPTELASTLQAAGQRALGLFEELGRALGGREAAARAGERVRTDLDLPDGKAGEQLFRDIEDLRSDVDRAEARLRRLEAVRREPGP